MRVQFKFEKLILNEQPTSASVAAYALSTLLSRSKPSRPSAESRLNMACRGKVLVISLSTRENRERCEGALRSKCGQSVCVGGSKYTFTQLKMEWPTSSNAHLATRQSMYTSRRTLTLTLALATRQSMYTSRQSMYTSRRALHDPCEARRNARRHARRDVRRVTHL